MRYFSTFSGIGGFELGIQQAYEKTKNSRVVGNQQKTNPLSGGQEKKHSTGMGDKQGERPSHESNESTPTCIGYSEIDKYATQVYQKHFPEHKNYGDITKINTDELPDFDCLVGGFPCQAFSIAGKRKGFDDTRGTLFFELARILRAKQPRLFVFENVKGLLSHDNGNTFQTIIATLDELGYDLQWQVLNSKNHGVPQNRERVFIVGHLRGTSRPEVFPFGEINSVHLREITSGVSDAQRIYKSDGLAKTLKGLGGGLGAKTGLYAMRGRENGQQLEYRGNETNTLTSVQKDNLWVEGMKIRRLTPIECERLQGFPDGWTDGVSDTQRYKCCGNAVTVNVIEDIFKRIFG